MPEEPILGDTGPPAKPETTGGVPPGDMGAAAAERIKEGEWAKLKEQVSSNRDAYIARRIVQHNYNFAPAAEGSLPRELSEDDLQPLDKAYPPIEVDEIVYGSEEVTLLLESLRRNRILILSGDREVGKGVVALLLAMRLTGMSLSRSGACCSKPLPSDMRINFEELTEEGGLFAGRIVILRDAFATRNKDFVRFVEELDVDRLKQISERLVQRGAHLIITSDSHRIPGPDLLERLRGLQVLQAITGPDEKAVAKALHRRAKKRVRQCTEALRERVDSWLEEEAQAVVEELRTMPLIVRFVDYYLIDVAKGELPFDQALIRTQRRAEWLFRELAQEPEVWCFVVSLALVLQPLVLRYGAPWHQFYRLWQAVTHYLERRELRVRQGARRLEDLAVDRDLLEKARAQLVLSPDGLGTFICFDATIDLELLWETLMGQGRGVLSSLVPLFTRLALEGDLPLREASARALGRIGKMDPFSITFPLIYEWAGSQEENLHVALGFLCQGVLGTCSAAYIESCLQHFRLATQHAESMQASAVALLGVGLLDLDLAIKELVDKLADGRLDKRIGPLARKEREILNCLEDESRAVGENFNDRAMGALVVISYLIFDEYQQRILDGVQASLEGLCLLKDPIRVLDVLKSRLHQATKDTKLASMLTLLFLRSGGIADVLMESKLAWRLVEEKEVRARPLNLSRLNVAVISRGDSAQLLPKLLEEIWKGAEAFPNLFCRAFKTRFVELVKACAEDACAIREARVAWETILANLLRSSRADLRSEVLNLLQNDPDFTKEGSELEELALNALVPRSVGSA
jgi:hypothetical protein